MSKNSKSPNQTPAQRTEVFYVVHDDHLHDFGTRQEAEFADTVFHGGKVWEGNELAFALEEVIRLRELTIAVTQLAMQHDEDAGGSCDCATCQTVRPELTKIALGVVDAFRAGRLDSSLTPAKFVALSQQIGRMDAVEKVARNAGRLVRVVASRPAEGQASIASLIGQEFEIAAYNPATEQVQVLAPVTFNNGGPIILSPDEYVYVDEAATAPQAE